MDFDMGDVGAAGIIEGLGQGVANAAKNLYTIQQAKHSMDMKQEQVDSEVAYRHAQVDYLEDRGQLPSAQAEAIRFNIDQAKKKASRVIDVHTDMIDHSHQQVLAQGSQYRNLLNQAIQTPEGQDYLAQKQSGAAEAEGPAANDQGSPVVNSVMPGVGANQDAGNGSFVPVTPAGAMKGLEGNNQPTKRNSSLQHALGRINAMGIDSRDDAEHAMDKYYGADWKQNPDAVNFLNEKFGTPGGAPAGGQGGASAAGGAAAPNANDMVKVTAPDGTPYTLPRANLQKALQRGYRVRQ